MGRIRYTHAVGMDGDELVTRLRSRAIGVLSLARESAAYGFPVAHYYDGENLYVRLCGRRDGRKITLAETTSRASLVVTGGETPAVEWSVVASGPLARVSKAEMPDQKTLDSWFAPVQLFDESLEELRPTLFRLDYEWLTGRRSCGDVETAVEPETLTT